MMPFVALQCWWEEIQEHDSFNYRQADRQIVAHTGRQNDRDRQTGRQRDKERQSNKDPLFICLSVSVTNRQAIYLKEHYR